MLMRRKMMVVAEGSGGCHRHEFYRVLKAGMGLVKLKTMDKTASNMMCEVMPTINEGDSVSSQRSSQNGTDAESNFEQLMVNMLDERDKLLESLRETQETLIQSQTKLQDVLHERDVLQRQLNSALPQVAQL
ncbi:hypothetical protein DNTS_017587 [Danionella cerebrum]|uniref:Uncharacterized protein n=1 Tax=Danionella cerebrum TaxID=2873325 RepID=A0A553REE2_9TELE|nr:hypothetical protein DNTS_017587 [Danionella translucida]